jgi:dienelactone hydrolase
MTHERFTFRSREGEKLRADLRYIADGSPKPVVVFLHGFKGFKDWGAFPAMLEQFAEAGFVSIAFNFSHNGVGDDLLNFTELDRFARNTFTRELEEVEDVLLAIERKEVPIDASELNWRVGLMGHSRGAAMAILAGRWIKYVRAVVALAPTSTYHRYTDRQKEKWRREGRFSVLNHRTGQVMSLDVGLLDDLEAHSDRLDILAAAHQLPRLEKPLLVIHGSEDLTTKPEEAEAIAKAADGPFTQLEILSNTGHTFGAEHPYKGMAKPMQAVIDHSAQFFQKYLLESPLPLIG